MADNRPLYPPPPTGVPPAFARPGLRYRLRLLGVLAALMLFLAFYLVLVVVALAVLVLALLPPAILLPHVPDSTAAQIGLAVLRLGLACAAAMFGAYLVKGFLRRRPDDTSNWLPVSAADQPALFDFIHRLCAEIGCTPPPRVFLNHEANAAISGSTSIASLLVTGDKDLVIGLGLLGLLDLVEFKSLLAHEFGHLTQRELALALYVQRLYQFMYNMVYGRDRWDDWMIRASDLPVVSVFLVPLAMFVDVTRAVLRRLFSMLRWAHGGLSWQMEYHADLVAVGAAGTDAFVRVERKAGLAQAALQVCAYDLALAAEQGLFTRDLFFHQQQAATRITGDVSMPASSSHPSTAQRLQHVRAIALPSPADERPAWLLLRDRPTVCAEVTRDFYWLSQRADPDTLAEPEAIEAFLAEERGALTIAERYRGVYDGRYLALDDLEAWITAGSPSVPTTDAEVGQQLHNLYDDALVRRVAEHATRVTEFNRLADQSVGATGAAAALEHVRIELLADQANFATFDGLVFALHDQLANRLGCGEEYRQRYRFHAGLQQVAGRLHAARSRLIAVLRFLTSGQPWFVNQLGGLLVEVSEAVELINAAQAHAALLLAPPLRHVKAGQPLAGLLPPCLATDQLATPDAVMAGAPLVAAEQALGRIIDRVEQLRARSLNGILSLQEGLVREWSAPQSAEPVR